MLTMINTQPATRPKKKTKCLIRKYDYGKIGPSIVYHPPPAPARPGFVALITHFVSTSFVRGRRPVEGWRAANDPVAINFTLGDDY